MRTLNQLPCIALLTGNQLRLVRNPTNGCRINENLRARERRRPCAFGKPLVPTDKCPHSCVTRLKARKAEITRSKIKLFVVEWIVWNVHLAIDTRDRPIGVDDHRSV